MWSKHVPQFQRTGRYKGRHISQLGACQAVIFLNMKSWFEFRSWMQACGKYLAGKSVGMACLTQAYIVIHHVRNNSPKQRSISQIVFCCCGRGQTCWQSREGSPERLFGPLKYVILSHILSLRKEYHVLTLSHWNGNRGLSSYCTGGAWKCSDRHHPC